MDVKGFLSKKIFQVDGFTLSVLGLIALVVVLWFVFSHK